jgi:hypothetical protein
VEYEVPKNAQLFAPLLTDAAMAIIYYTGEEKLSDAEIKRLTGSKNIYIQQSRPSDITETVKYSYHLDSVFVGIQNLSKCHRYSKS